MKKELKMLTQSFVLILLSAIVILAGCNSATSHASGDLPLPAKDLPPGKPGESQTLVIAGGCFWCTEGVFQNIDGVSEVVSGYAGGTKETATYEQVSMGNTGHAEAVKIIYDPSKVSYGKLLQIFFTVFNPTTLDSQGPDHGHQYRSAIFYASDEEKQVAAAYIKQLTDAKLFDDPIVTTLEPLDGFYAAETYHQDFVNKNPNQGYVRAIAMPKIFKAKGHFGQTNPPATSPSTKPAGE